MAHAANDIFISYKAEDRPRLSPLIEALEAEGFDVWWDQHIGGGTNWREEIESHLEGARCVIVVWSKQTIGPNGRFVRDEAGHAQEAGHYLPVTIDDVRPPLGFREVQAVDLSNWWGKRDDPLFRTLVASAHAMLSGSNAPAPVRHVAPAAGPSPPQMAVSRRAVMGGAAVAGVAAAGGLGWFFLHGSAANANSVAVLPFANLSGDPNQAYFSDGLAEEVRNALSRISGLKVIGRTSSEVVRSDDATTAAKRLDAGSIVTGSVRRSPTTVRVSAQLVDGGTGVEKWSQTFDRPNGDVLQIQTSIAEAVAEQLRSRLGAADKAAISAGGTSNADAQDLFLKALNSNDTSRAGLNRDIGLLDVALALDPNYAHAYALKGWAVTQMAGGYAATQHEMDAGIASGAALARKGIAIAPDFAPPHYVLGFNRGMALDFQGQWDNYRRALDCPGCSPDIKSYIATFVSGIGGSGLASRLLQSAADSDPLNIKLINARAGQAFNERRFADGLALTRQYLAKAPDSTGGKTNIAYALYFLGRYAEALHDTEQLGDVIDKSVLLACIAGKTGDGARARSILDGLRSQYGDLAHYQYAEILAQIGDKGEAIAELQGALRNRDPGLSGILSDNAFDPLHGESGYEAIVRQLNFPDLRNA